MKWHEKTCPELRPADLVPDAASAPHVAQLKEATVLLRLLLSVHQASTDGEMSDRTTSVSAGCVSASMPKFELMV